MRKKTFTSVSGKKYDCMMGRCYREKDISYKYYGRLGIKVCSEWIKNIDFFRAWLLNELARLHIDVETFVSNSKHYQLERKDNKEHYTTDNCTIASTQNNSRNRKSQKTIIIISAEGERIKVTPTYK